MSRAETGKVNPNMNDAKKNMKDWLWVLTVSQQIQTLLLSSLHINGHFTKL